MKVLVCDDEQTRFDVVSDELRQCGIENLEIIPLIGKDLTTALEKLFKRVKIGLERANDYKTAMDLPFDEADLAIFDNNLAHLEIGGTRLTAESVVGYVRCFSGVPFIVSLNKNPDVDFDLRYLMGDYETRADLALNTEHLANTHLWTRSAGEPHNEMRPWYWPPLTVVPTQRRNQIAFIIEQLDAPILNALGFPTDEESLGFLSLHAKGALSPEAVADGNTKDGKPITEITFRDAFIAGSRSLPAKDEREALAVGSSSGNTGVNELLARVVAADIDRWFRRDVLGPQEMLVDVAHLLVRMPFLLGTRANDVREWNNAIAAHDTPFGMERRLFDESVAPARFPHDMWIPNAAFWWPLLKKNDQLGELFFAENQDWADAVFCEDTSSFVVRSPEPNGGGPIEFSTEFEGSWARRHVAKLEGVRYAPRSRFAVG